MSFRIRRAGHVVLRVTNVAQTKDFLETVVGFTTYGKVGREFYFLTSHPVSNHHMIAIRPGEPGERLPDADRQIGMVSIAYEMTDLAALRDLHRRMSAAADTGPAVAFWRWRTVAASTISSFPTRTETVTSSGAACREATWPRPGISRFAGRPICRRRGECRRRRRRRRWPSAARAISRCAAAISETSQAFYERRARPVRCRARRASPHLSFGRSADQAHCLGARAGDRHERAASHAEGHARHGAFLAGDRLVRRVAGSLSAVQEPASPSTTRRIMA